MNVERDTRQRGSAMIMAVFVLALLAVTGVALLFVSANELKMSRSDVSSKQLYFLAEAGLEDGRYTIFNINRHSLRPRDLSEELDTVAGANNSIDFDPAALRPVYDPSTGIPTGFSGYGDDAPLKAITPFTDGFYAAFMQNDPAEGVNTITDVNNRLLLTAMAVRKDRRVETVRALVWREDTFAIPPATITILGPDPIFDGGSSNAKYYVGDDNGSHCPSPYDTSGFVPVVGVIGADAQSDVANAMNPARYANYSTDSGTETGVQTVNDLTTDPNLPEMWTNCEMLVELASLVRDQADLVGNSATPRSQLGVPGSPKSVYINGDYTISGNWNGAGLLFVTGTLDLSGQSGWQGPIFVIGEGDFLRSGNGNGTVSGGIIVADVAGPDRVLFTADDCAGEDGVKGTSDDGIARSSFLVNGAGTSTTGYCSGYFTPWQSMRPFKILSFLQD